MKYADLTWRQIEAMNKSRVIVFVPLGAMEQYGLTRPKNNMVEIEAIAAKSSS